MIKSFIKNLAAGMVCLFLVLSICSCSQNAADNGDSAVQYDCDYLIIGYLDGDNNLSGDIEKDMQHMALGLRSSDAATTKVLIMFDGYDTVAKPSPAGATCLFEMNGLTKSEFEEITISDFTKTDYTESCGFIPYSEKLGHYEANMSDCENLKNLLDFAADNYKPKHTLLMVSDHGAGTASSTESTLASRSVCTDDTWIASEESNGKPVTIGNDELAEAIRSSKLKKVDILHIDACLESSIENAYELKDCAGYLVASPNISTGVPWDTIIGEYISDSITPANLASQIVIEVCYDRKTSEAEDRTGITNSLAATSDVVQYSPTYTAMNLSYAKELFAYFSDFVLLVDKSIDNSDFYKACKEANPETGMVMQYLNDYINGTYNEDTESYDNPHSDYVPMPVDYLVSRDYSFLLSRNPHGWVGAAPETDINGNAVAYSARDTNAYSIINHDAQNNFVSGKTTMSYMGSYSQLVDVGYLMDMFICNTAYSGKSDKELKAIEIAEINGTKFTAYEFMAICERVVFYLEKTIMVSHRNNCLRPRTITSSNLNTASDIDYFNFYVQDILGNEEFSTVLSDNCLGLNLTQNHYGIVVSTCAVAEFDNSDNTYNPVAFQSIGKKPAGVSDGRDIYRGSCAFVNECGWLDLLDKIFCDDYVNWNYIDCISDDETCGL